MDFNYLPLTATFTVNYGGVYNFSSLDAGSLGFSNLCAANGAPAALCPDFPGFTGLQAFGLGIPSTLVQGIGNPKDSFSNKPLGVFWQDSFRVRQNLTFNFGVRYDMEFPPQFAPAQCAGSRGLQPTGTAEGHPDRHQQYSAARRAWRGTREATARA